MPILKIYATNKDEEPKAVFCGAKWIWEPDKNIIIVWFNDAVLDFTCTELDNTDLIFSAYGEIVPPEEIPEEIIGF